MPGVEVRAEHHEFIGQIGAGYLAEYVARRLDGLSNPVMHLDFDRDGDVAGQDAIHAVVVFRRHGDDGDGRQGFLP